MTTDVELIYDRDCPNVGQAREVLLRAFREAGRRPSWTEWDRDSPESPAYVRGYGSPTILVGGRDVAGAPPGEACDACRIYDHGDAGLAGVPPARLVAAALAASSSPVSMSRATNGGDWWSFAVALPGVGAALLPAGVCPACWPAYAGILGALGLGFVLDSTYLLPLTVALLGLMPFTLAYRARSRRGYGPFALGTMSVSMVLLFKFAYEIEPLVYAGLLGLLVAAAWNAWPKAPGPDEACSACAEQGPATHPDNAT